MSEKFHTETGSKRWLLIFSETGCMREELPNFRDGVYSFYLTMQVTGKEEAELLCHAVRGRWYVQENLISENAPIYFERNGQQFLVFLSGEIREWNPQEVIHLRQEEKVKIGNAYQNIIFYDSFSLVEPEHLEIGYEENEYVLCVNENKGIYINEKAVAGKYKLNSGDRIDLYGLHIVFLNSLLVVTSFHGIYRVAGGGRWKRMPYPKGNIERKKKIHVERYSRKEEALHRGEVEILPPGPVEKMRRSPLILGLGPSLTMVLPVFVMTLMGSKMGQAATGNFYRLSLVMSLCSSFLALFWGMVNHFYGKYQERERVHNRVVQYREYLGKTEAFLEKCREENKKILERRYPPISFFVKESSKVIVMWDRFYKQNDFMFLRVGVGNVPFQMKIKYPGEKSIVPENLWLEAGKLAEKMSFLSEAPVGVNFDESWLLGIVGRGGMDGMHGILVQLLFQLAACHSYREVKVACFYEKKSEMQCRVAELIKWMPHSWSDDRRIRYVAGDEKETAEILPDLTKEAEKATENQMLPRYLLILLTDEWIRGEPIYQYLINRTGEHAISAVFLENERERLPVGCNCLLVQTGQTIDMICYGEETISRQQIKPEFCKESVFQNYLRQIAGYRIWERENDGRIPEKVGFLELYACTKVNQLNCIEKWNSHRPEERMKIPIGMRGGSGVVSLDIHEKFHGPHGLIAGTTGSGKSELIQTCILSMAVAFSPQDINFFMIDYKGGGTGNMLQSLPHCSGVISNLSGKQIKRAMSAISSENRRRQELFSKYKVNHIDGYTELFRVGKVKEPMPHLMLVIDEFAELKKEEPEFMQEIISLAQVGRSLGMHLILATQKPAGTVDDKIWSNARFRLCLRVQDKQDSMDMLHKNDAALLTLPGQCYLQIGNHEYYELFQTAYCGGEYLEDGEEKDKVCLISDTGKRIKEEKNIPSKHSRTELEMVLNYVNQVAEENGYDSARSLWMPELKQFLVLEEIETEEIRSDEKYILGMCDDPANQRQYPATYSPVKQGHLMVCGNPATGKTTLLQTLLWQLAHESPEKLQILIVDLAGALGKSYQSYPQILGYLYGAENQQVFFYHLKRIFEERKELLSGMNYIQYEKAGKGTMPPIFLVIDNYGALAKLLNEQQEELLIRMAGEGINYGFYLILSVSAPGEVPGKLFGKIKKTIALELSEKFAYGDIMRQYHLEVYPAEDIKGRGLYKEDAEILEFQTAVAIAETEDYQRMKLISEEGERLQKAWLHRIPALPEKFPQIPVLAESRMLCERFLMKENPNHIPLGYNLVNGRIEKLQIGNKNRFLILGRPGSGKKTLLAHLAEGLWMQKRKIVIYDGEQTFILTEEKERLRIFSRWEELQKWIEEPISESGSRKKEECLLIIDMADFVRKLYQNRENIKLHKRWEEEAAGGGKIAFMAGGCEPDVDYEVQGTVFFREFISRQQGICLGGNVGNQRMLSFDDLSYSLQNEREKPGIGYFKSSVGAETKKVKLPLWEGREKHDSGRY